MFKPFQFIIFNTINIVNWLVFSERFLYTVNLYPLLQKPHFQIMPIYNSFIIFLVGFLPLVGEFLPQTPDKNRRENLKIFSPSGARWA